MAAPNPACPSFKKWRGISNRANQRIIEESKPPVFAPKFNVYVPEELQDLLQSRPKLYSPSNLKAAAAAIKGGDSNQWLPAVTAVRQALSKTEKPPYQEVLDLEILPRLVTFIGMRDSPKLQLEAAWAVCNVASGTTAQCTATVEAGAIPPALALLSSENPSLREQAAWLLGNIAGDGAGLRDVCLDAGLLPPLLAAAKKETEIQPLRQYAWLLLNVTRFKPRKRSTLLEVLPTLAQIVSSHKDVEVLADALSALAHVADDCVGEVLKEAKHTIGLAAAILGEHQGKAVTAAAAKVLSSLCAGDDAATQAVVDTGVLSRGYKLLVENKKTDRAVLVQVCFALSNIAAGTKAQALAVMEAGLLEPLTQLFKCCDHKAVQREIVWVLSNMTSKHIPAMDRAVLEAGAAPVLAEAVATMGIRAETAEQRAGVAAAEALHGMAKNAAAGDGPNLAVAEYVKSGVYETLQRVLDGGGLSAKIVHWVEALMKQYPPPQQQ